METAISVNHLVHSFGERRAVDDLTFEVGRGEVFGLLGPNGAGKTTTVRLLNGLYQPSGGAMRILGLDPAANGEEVRARTGVLTETPALYERLTAYQNLEFFGQLADMKPADLKQRITELLEFFELENRANDKAGTYSKGMKQRLALARALLTRPEVLFLDEPTTGLDPESSLQVRELIDTIRHKDGHTVFMCTHLLSEAERLCDRVAILNSGRLLALGSLEELSRLISPGLWVEAGLWEPMAARPDLLGLPGVLEAAYEDERVRFEVQDESAIPGVVTALVQAGAKLTRLQPEQITLEDVYFKLQEQSRQDVK
jgi:ABC-2 type transport system ATP-binding protein